LRGKLTTYFSEAIVWRDECEGEVSVSVTGMLENTLKECDFAVIILTQKDIEVRKEDDPEERQALDNCYYEAGLFIATLGLDRCFLISNVQFNELPLNFEGIQFLHFDMSTDSTEVDRWESAVEPAISKIIQSVKDKGRLIRQETLPLMSVEKVFEREQLERKGGQLQEGYVMVCDAEPFEREQWALQVKDNMDHGVSYIYFFHADNETANKISSLLRIMLLTDKEGKPPPVEQENDVIIMNLKNILKRYSLDVYFMPTSPAFRFRIHNASDPNRARAYLRYGETPYFVEWREGVDVRSIWNFFELFSEPRRQEAVFRSNKNYDLYQEDQKFLSKLKQELNKSFPQINDEMIKLCFQSEKIEN